MVKKLLHTVGSLIAVISIVFVGQQLVDNWQKINHFRFDAYSIGTLVFGAISYSLSCYLLARAWNHILGLLSRKKVPFKVQRSIYARTQIAKYIPGNVLQIAGRHVLLKKLGFSHKSLAAASIIEMLGLVSASCTVTLCAVLLFGLGRQFINLEQLYIGLIGIISFFLLTPLVIFYLKKYFSLFSSAVFSQRLQKAFFRAYLIYLVFFLCAGTILLVLVNVISGITSIQNAIAVIAIFSLSWLAGFITPGAPSGIGIRETILVVTLDKVLAGNFGSLIAILFRLITVMGDVLFFYIAGRQR